MLLQWYLGRVGKGQVPRAQLCPQMKSVLRRSFSCYNHLCPGLKALEQICQQISMASLAKN